MDTKASQKQLIGLITEHLSESIPVTRILTYKPDKSGAVTGKFESLNRVYNFVFKGEDVRYKPAGSMDSALFSDYYLERFDAAPAVVKGTRALPKCTSQSYSCKGQKGVACITLTKSCKIGTDAIGRERLNKIKKLSSDLADAVMFDFEPDPTNQKKLADLEKSQAKIVEKRMALAVEKKAQKNEARKRSPLSATETIDPPKATKTNSNVSIKELDKGLQAWNAFHEQFSGKDWYDQDSFEDQMTVTDYIKEEGITERNKDTEHIGIIGKNGKLQSALTGRLDKEKGFYIDNLATAPWNLSPEDHPDKEKGSGAKAILEAIKKSKDANLGGKISLEALPAAIPFYEHLGFTPVKRGRNDYVLTPEAADKLIKKYSG